MTFNLTAKLGAYTKLGVDNELSLTSEAPVQNKVITEAINEVKSDYVKKESLQDGGIKSTTKTQMFGGDFSVTTSQSESLLSPYARASVTGRLSKHYYYEIICNDITYTLPSELYFQYERTGTKVYEYLGNISLYTDDLKGITNPIRNEIPFCIISDLDDSNSIDVFTTTVGTYTFNVKKLIDTFESLPLELVSRTNYPLVSQSTNANETSSTYANFSAVGPNRVENRGTIAIGHSNICDGEFAMAIGGKNQSAGKYGTAIGWNNSISVGGSSSAAIGSGNTIGVGASGAGGSAAIGTGNSVLNNYSFACNTDNTVSAASAFACGSSNVIENYGGWQDPNHNGTGAYCEGNANIVRGRYAHCEGQHNLAYGLNQHIEGKYNIADENDEFAHIVGNGTSDNERSNAYTLDWQGNAVFAGEVTTSGLVLTGNKILVLNEDFTTDWYYKDNLLYVTSLFVTGAGQITVNNLSSGDVVYWKKNITLPQPGDTIDETWTQATLLINKNFMIMSGVSIGDSIIVVQLGSNSKIIKAGKACLHKHIL